MLDVQVKLEYEGSAFLLVDSGYTDFDHAEFMWTDGNCECDCTRSSLIKNKCDSSFPELQCGDKIKLISLEENPPTE